MLTIVIDPGHGGAVKVGGSSHNNATGPAGTLEKNITLAIARAAKSALSQNNKVILTRDYDINLGLAERANVAFKNEADLFLSIHLNGWHNPSVQGTECYHHELSNLQSKNFAQIVQTETIKVTGLRNRGVKAQNMGVLRPARHLSNTAACLLEVSFLTDPAEEIRLNNKTYIDRLGHAIFKACEAFNPNAYDDVTPQPRIKSGQTSTPGIEFEDGSSLNAKSKTIAVKKLSSLEGLQDVKGIGPARERALLAMNIKSLTDLTQLRKSKINQYAESLRVSEETIEDWIEQAKNKILSEV